MTSDPVGLLGGVNLFTYANGSPVTFTDPYGLCPLGGLICVGVPAAIVAIGAALAVDKVIDTQDSIDEQNKRLSDFLDDPNSVNANDLQQGQKDILKDIGESAKALGGLKGDFSKAKNIRKLPICK